MKILSCDISIGKLNFNYVVSVDVDSSWELLTDKGTIELPANIKVDRHQLSKSIKVGDEIAVKCGYDGVLNTIFQGFVVGVKPKVPIEIMVEDEMWKLKQNTLNDSGRKQTLSELLDRHFSAYEHDEIDIELGSYYIDNLSGAKLLESIKKDFGLFSFFRDKKLIVGKRYNRETATVHNFKLDYNIAEDDLEFKSKEDVKIKVKAISNNADGTKEEVELGDPEGDARTLNFYNLSKKELQTTAELELERFKYDGFRGSFKAFGEPFVKHGDIVNLIYQEEGESEKSGKYWVDSVGYSYGTDGYRQDIKLGSRT